MYIVLEGIVGTGKTTQSTKLHKYLKRRYPKKEVILTREPGGDEIAENIRKVVQGLIYNIEMEPTCEAYLYAASRAQTLRSIVKPVLEKDGIVISDRSFVTSLSYQAYGLGLGFDKVLEINKPAVIDVMPDLVLYMDLDLKKALSRTFDKDGDRHEKKGLEFFEKAVEGYTKASKLPMFKGRWIVINTDQSVEKVFRDIKRTVLKKMKK